MLKNDVLRRMRYILDYNDQQMINVFKAAGVDVSKEQLTQWLKKDDDPDFKSCKDSELAIFLNGLIIEKRGENDKKSLEAETILSNNGILKKLFIAFNLRADDVLDLLKLADFNLSKHELSAFMRRVDHKNYRECKAQILRNFLKALQLKHRT